MGKMEVGISFLPRFAKDFVSALPQKAAERAYIVGLAGELGAGKTTFVQEVAKALGVATPVTSPTFIIASRYPIQKKPFTSLVHMDAYRLGKGESFDWHAYANDPQNLVLIEWPERMPDFPPDSPVFSFTVIDETTRDIKTHG